MQKAVIAVLFLALFSVQTFAQDLSAVDSTKIANAAETLGSGVQGEERIAAFRKIQEVLEDNKSIEGVSAGIQLIETTAIALESQAKISRGLEGITKAGSMPLSQSSIAAAVASIQQSAQKMQDKGSLPRSSAARLAKSISNLDKKLQQFGRPGLAKSISEFTGDPNAGKAFSASLSLFQAFGSGLNTLSDFQAADEEDVRKFAENFVKAFAPASHPVLSLPSTQLAIDNIAWTNEMFGQSAAGLDVIGNAIETGRFDSKRYNEVADSITNLVKRGPWGSDTAKRYVKQLCKAIGPLKPWCDKIFSKVEEALVGLDCKELTCDCANVGGGLLSGPRRVQCEIAESTMLQACKADSRNVPKCDAGAKGPGATR